MLPVVFVIKRLIYIEFMVFWKGKVKEKEKLEVKGGQGGLLLILKYVSRPGPLCHDRVVHQRARQVRSASNKAHDKRATEILHTTECPRA